MVKKEKTEAKTTKTQKVKKVITKSKENKKKTLGENKNNSRKKRQLSKRFRALVLKPNQLTTNTIVYVGHLPKGFNESELKGFFT